MSRAVFSLPGVVRDTSASGSCRAVRRFDFLDCSLGLRQHARDFGCSHHFQEALQPEPCPPVRCAAQAETESSSVHLVGQPATCHLSGKDAKACMVQCSFDSSVFSKAMA